MVNFIKGAIKHPGIEKAKAKANGISTHEQLEKDSHSKDPTVRSRGNLGLRFEKGGDLHKSDGGHGAQPELKGGAKASHRGQEHRVSEGMHTKPSGAVDHKAEHNDNGMIRAMHKHADSVHPVKQSYKNEGEY